MPEYGRLVQMMADEALKMEDRAERQAYAEAIIGVMRGLNPQMKNTPGFREKLWDHLAYICDYRMDIDYPCEIRRPEQGTPPPIPYPENGMRYRHYGTLVERALKEAGAMSHDQQRTEALRGIATRMKRCLAEFREEQPDDRRVEHDIERVSDGAAHADFSAHPLAYVRMEQKDYGKKRKKK